MPVQTQIQVRRGTASSWTSTNPTLAAGEIGFETDTGKIKVGNGSSTWSALNYVGAANAIQYVYNASAGQTSFSGADSNGLTLSYTVGAEQVYVNGVLQVRTSDYTATNGTSVTLTTATIASDVVTIVAFGTFDIANTYTQAQANATFPLNSIDKSAGKNRIINGDFGIWQRGTSISIPVNTTTYSADRSAHYRDGSGGTVTVTQQAFTAGSAPVAGYEAQYFLQYAKSVAGTGGTVDYFYHQRIEDVRTFANQTVTISFWAKADAARNINIYAQQSFGSGGSAVTTTTSSSISLTTGWVRYSATLSIPSVSGKTIGTGSFLEVGAYYTNTNLTCTFGIWGVQVEAGSVATSFQTATGTIQGELAACQRYYYLHASGVGENMASGGYYNANLFAFSVAFPVTMRIAPSLVYTTGTNYYTIYANNGTDGVDVLSIARTSTKSTAIDTGTGTAGTLGQAGVIATNNASSSVAFNAEL